MNDTQHEHKYTALHFAALSGNPEICLALLSAGAKSHVTNTIGKTAAQMAAFVGTYPDFDLQMKLNCRVLIVFHSQVITLALPL